MYPLNTYSDRDRKQAHHIPTAIDLALSAVDLTTDESLDALLTDEYAMLAMLYLEEKDALKANEYGRKAWALLGNLGYLGPQGGVGEYSLKTLLAGIEKMGGKGRTWKDVEREKGRR